MSETLYRGFSRTELEAFYSHGNRIENYDSYLLRWPEQSAEVRDALLCECDVPYGPNAAETYDVFPAGSGSPIHVFFHGGSWYSHDKSDFEFMAPALVDKGITLICANYPLCPGVRLTSLLDSCLRSLEHVFLHARDYGADPDRIFVSGHSAGGHIAACLLNANWLKLDDLLPQDLVKGAVAISGVYDLEPIRLIAMNQFVRLDSGEVQALSPIFNISSTAGSLVLAVGTNEGEEFNRQQAAYADAWRASGHSCTALVLEGEDHFSIIDGLAKPESKLFQTLLAQAGL